MSTKGLRQYEHTSAKQLQAAGLAVANETTYTPGDAKERKPLAPLNKDLAAQLKQDPATAATVGGLKSLPSLDYKIVSSTLICSIFTVAS